MSIGEGQNFESNIESEDATNLRNDLDSLFIRQNIQSKLTYDTVDNPKILVERFLVGQMQSGAPNHWVRVEVISKGFLGEEEDDFTISVDSHEYLIDIFGIYDADLQGQQLDDETIVRLRRIAKPGIVIWSKCFAQKLANKTVDLYDMEDR